MNEAKDTESPNDQGSASSHCSSALQHATEMAEMWQYRGNVAAEKGKDDLAERHYERSQKWRDKMNHLLGND